MKKLVDFITLTVGGWAGWAVGAPVSIFTAYVTSVVGAGLAMYLGRKVMKRVSP
jgi:phosphate/sulfate permease